VVNGIDAARVNGPGDQAGQARILIVDDEAMIRALLTEILSQEGYDVIAAEDGEVAVSILEGGGIDLIITDMLMPRGSGIEVLRAARRYDPRIPVIIMTGYPSIEDAAALATLDVSEYVSKPFDLDAILELVGTHLEEHRRHRGRGDTEPA
jgi:DNA-binding NtrC family response regulator